MNGLGKDAASMIRINQDFFDGLSGIEQVVVYGHSFYEVDWPYLEEIVKQIGKDKSWSISYHEPKDLKQIESFIQKSRFEKCKNVQLVNCLCSISIMLLYLIFYMYFQIHIFFFFHGKFLPECQ